ncbi:MAG: response regulator [Eubacterium sp.]|nr:response regulator [Candidatus Colimonas fimequi]
MMKALCVDDEILLLEILKKSVLESPDISEVAGFRSAIEALDWAKENPDGFDIAFLDIQIQKMNGLELAEELRKLNHRLPVVFCTGYEEYALDAFKVHAAGYLTKPIHPADVQEQIDTIKEILDLEDNKKLEVKCFGNFEVYADGKPLSFKRKKSK